MVRQADNTRARTILIADNQPGFRQVIADTVLCGGIEVIEAYDGHSLVRRARDDRPDLILVNDALHNPDVGSAVHLLRAHDHTADIPIILLTESRSGDEAEGSADQAAAVVDQCLSKPFSPLELVETIDRLLEPLG